VAIIVYARGINTNENIQKRKFMESWTPLDAVPYRYPDLTPEEKENKLSPIMFKRNFLGVSQ
jgi:hypothetical protein